MASKNKQVAEAVKARLLLGPWCVAFAPVISRDAAYEVPELATPRVTIIPQGRTVERQDRQDNAAGYLVGVCIQQATADADARDALIELAEQIADAFVGRRHGPAGDFFCESAEHVPMFNVEHLREHGVLTTTLGLRFVRQEQITN